LDANGMPVDSVLPAVAVIGGNSGPQMTITRPDGSPATAMGPSVGVIGGNPSPYPAYTFSAPPSSGAGSQDLRGIQFLEPLPVMPAPQGFVPRSGDLGNQMAVNNFINDIGHRTQINIDYSKYAAERQGMWNETPVAREYYHP
jgi:hypothetical protein